MPDTPRPRAGEDTDERRLIALPFSVAQPDIAVPVGHAIVRLSRVQLEQLAQAASIQWSTEEERLARIDGQRAQALLKSASGGDAAPAPLDPDAHHLLSRFIEQGLASIFCGTTPQPQPHVTVRYLASRAGPLAGRGDILFHLPDDPTPFLAVNWWVA
ncbi:hypothetical protein [Variovorax sp. V15]|uniref:hypothetical protein n=1 Tax=Variovorax sp. V15 TaxID=3065952 RepID=UPI0034E89399